VSDEVPIPRVESITNDGKMKIAFSAALQVPDDFQQVKEQEVALRSGASRTETYLTDTGYVDFQIRPALDLQIAPADSSEPEKLSFDWEIIEYTEYYVVIQLKFENPEALSALDGKSLDEVQITFWGDNLFVGKNGKSVPNGVTIKKAVVRQVNPEESDRLKRFARILGYTMIVSLLVMFAIGQYTYSDTYPVWAVVNMLLLATHFPLLYLQLPGGISLFMKEFLSVLRLQDLQLEGLLWYWGVTGDLDPAFIKDSGHNIYFEQLGYSSRYIVRNCPLPLLLLALWTVLCLFAYLVEFAKNRDSIRKGRLVNEKPSFGINGRLKQYRSNYFHIAIQGLTRTLQVSFAELFLFGLVNMGEFSGDSKLSRFSQIACIVLMVFYTLFFLSLPAYRLFLQDYFSVQGSKAAAAIPKKKNRRQRVPSTDRDPDMNSSQSSDAPPMRLRRQSTMSVQWDEKVLWPGL